MWGAKLATSAAKPGFCEIPVGREREFLADRPVGELAGCGKRRERSLAALGAYTFGDVARMPSILLRKRFGIWAAQEHLQISEDDGVFPVSPLWSFPFAALEDSPELERTSPLLVMKRQFQLLRPILNVLRFDYAARFLLRKKHYSVRHAS